MRPYLNEYIGTLSSRREERVSGILENARVGKQRIDRIIQALEENVIGENNAVLRRHTPESLIETTAITMNLREIGLRIRDLYEVSNLISLLLTSGASLLSSDVKAIEDELVAMDKTAANFAFLLSDNQAYDYAFMEAFSDNLGREQGLEEIPDRTGNAFTNEQHAFVRIDEGVLTLPESLSRSHGLTPVLLKSNVSAFILKQNPLVNMLTPTTSSGWYMDIAAARPINSSLPEAPDDSFGAQALLEFRLTQPAPSSQVKVIPFADYPVDLLQVKVYRNIDDSEAEAEELLDEKRILDRPISLHFPTQSVAKFTVLIGQPTFQRRDRIDNHTELKYDTQIRQINKEIKEHRFYIKRSPQVQKLERTIQSNLMGKDHDFFSVSLPITDLEASQTPTNEVLRRLNNTRGKAVTWQTDRSERSYIVYDVMNQQDGKFEQLDLIRGKSDINMNVLSRPLSGSASLTPQIIPRPESGPDQNFNYYYSLGLHYVGIGMDNPRFKGVFVSEALPSPGDVGEVRLKAGVDNYILPVTDRASKILTSVEFSVSNKFNPEFENDWLPILPVDTDQVVGERLFPNEFGYCEFRFSASSGDLLQVYRNGYVMNAYEDVPGLPGEIVGIDIDETLIRPDDVFTVDYFPLNDNTVVSFEQYGFEDIPLVSAFDESGVGEGFSKTGERNGIKLSNRPYIDPSQTSVVGYSPITVIIDSTGQVPQNVTDYSTNQQSIFPSDDGYYYIHSGNMLLFNRPIASPFRVYYQYIQNNVRFRTVLRCNTQDFVSPKVDYVHVKAKTRNPDQRSL